MSPENRRSQRWLNYLGVGLIAISAILADTVTRRPSRRLATPPENRRLQRWWNYLGVGFIAVSAILAIIVAVNLTLHYFAPRSVPWQELIAIISGFLAVAGFSLIGSRHHKEGREPSSPEPSTSREGSSTESSTKVPPEGYPDPLQSTARRVKALLQMAIGIYALGWLAWAFYHGYHVQNCQQLCSPIPAAKAVFSVTADALGAATAVQLAFTLFTPGPDEALDPVLLALAAAMLLQLGSVTTFKWQDGIAIILYSIALGIIFVIRIFLAPDENDKPDPWWWKGR